MKKNILQVFIGLIVACVALYFGFRNISFSELYKEISDIQFIYLLPAVLVMIFSHWLRAYRWKLFFHSSELNSDKTYPFFSATMIGYAVNNVIPRGGEIGKAVYLSNQLKISQSKILGTVVLERLLDFISLIIIFGITSLTYSKELNLFFPGLGIVAVVIFFASLTLLVLFTFVPKKGLYKFTRRNFALINIRFGIKIAGIISLFTDGIGALKKSDKQLQILVISGLIWFSYCIMTWIPLFAFEFQNTAKLSFLAGIAVMTISSIGVILPSPGGIGTFHVFCSSVLVNLFGILQIDALSYATVVQLMNLIVTSVLGAGVFLIDRIRKSK